MFTSIELFAGAGGLGIGVSRAGFMHDLVVEWNADSCNTIRANRYAAVQPVSKWPNVTPTDVRHVDFRPYEGKTDLLSGGPPCQPFSLGGKHRGHNDNRNMFPEVVRAVREIKPKAILVENVKGLLRQSFATYFAYVALQLQYPEIEILADEEWINHHDRLEQHHTASSVSNEGLRYNIVYRLFNSANFGVPQRRERVIIVGFRSDLGVEWSFPQETHSENALMHSQFVTGDYWEKHGVSLYDRRRYPKATRSLFDFARPEKQPWVTVRDAISDLPDPRSLEASFNHLNHVFVGGARSYAGHTGSPLDEPAKALKAGDHGVPGGENMILHPDGSIRYFTVREAARVQTFPDNYVFSGTWTEAMRQLGNAVPVKLAEVMATSIRSHL